MTVWSFGDSWAWGSGLENKEKRFGDFLSDSLNTNHINKGREGLSLGNILEIFTKNINEIKKDDYVVIIIPPDIRWYSAKGDNFYSLYIGQKEYKRFIKDKTPYWFTYHHSLFIYTLIKICKDLKCKFILAHNYGNLIFEGGFNSLIEKRYFLDVEKSLTTLLGAKDWANNYSSTFAHDGPPELLEGKYFIKNNTHPNEEGHKFIANLILQRFKEDV